jgi:DNA-binding IclR family transcriptional regulator
MIVFRLLNTVLVAEQTSGARPLVPAIDRAVRVLQLLGANEHGNGARHGLSLSELSRQLGLPKSTLSALLATLEHHDIVQRNPVTRYFRLGPGLLELAASASAGVDVRDAAQPQLERLRDLSDETAILHLVSGDGAVIAERAEPSNQLKVVAPLGMRLPPFAGSVARVLLAGLAPGPAEERVRAAHLPAFTPHSVIDVGAYLQELARTRRRGYALERGEYLLGVCAVSAPVIDRDGQTIGTVSVAGVEARVAGRLEDFIQPVTAAAAETSLRLGAPWEGRWQSQG